MRAWIYGIVIASAALVAGCDGGGDGTGGGGGEGGSGASGGGTTTTGAGGSGASTTTTIGTGGTTTTTTGAGGGSVECGILWDDRPDCQACMDNNCCAEQELCAAGTDCDELFICANACAMGDDACVQACIDAHQQGLEDFQTIQTCYGDNCETTLECSYPICESGLVIANEECATCLGDDAQCCDALTACAAEPACGDCLQDPTAAGCDTNTNFQTSDNCFSDGAKCGKSCTTGICDSGLSYPNAPACNFCLGQANADGGCCEDIKLCVDDADCLACLTGEQTGATCDNNALLTAFNTCRMMNCDADCN